MRATTILIVIVAIVVVLRLLRLVMPERATSGRPKSRRLITNRNLSAFLGLTVASAKMYIRNRTALFFSLFFPLVFITIFGLIFKNDSTSLNLDVTQVSHSQLADKFVSSLENVSALKIKKVSQSQASADLNAGNADLTIFIPASFGSEVHGHVTESVVTAHYNESRPGNGQAAAQLVAQIADGFNQVLTHEPTIVAVNATGVKTKNLTYIDFLLPGMIGLSIMQLGIFSVAFSFVSYKTTGMLRRLQATPIHPGSFLAAQGITRLGMAVVQTILLAAIGVWFFAFHLSSSSYGAFLLIALLGSAVFQAFGFAIAGWAKNEDQAQPVAQLIQFPMMFLSGTFFSRSNFPHWLNIVTGYLPLTYLTDALRQIANNGASLWTIRGDLMAMLIWGIIAAAVAIRVFTWE